VTFYLTPKILARELRLIPLVVFAALLVGALIFGPVGALVAAPLVAILLLFYRRLVLLDKETGSQPVDAD
jgi:predicted PurR-regulated permease PerM